MLIDFNNRTLEDYELHYPGPENAHISALVETTENELRNRGVKGLELDVAMAILEVALVSKKPIFRISRRLCKEILGFKTNVASIQARATYMLINLKAIELIATFHKMRYYSISRHAWKEAGYSEELAQDEGYEFRDLIYRLKGEI